MQGSTSICHPPCVSQTMVTEQAAQGSSPPDLRIQYLRQIHANHEVSPTALSSEGCSWPEYQHPTGPVTGCGLASLGKVDGVMSVSCLTCSTCVSGHAHLSSVPRLRSRAHCLFLDHPPAGTTA
jgi:hypothetical protein